MNTNKYKIFKEAGLSKNFCQQDLTAIQKLIDQSTTFSLASLPALGTSMFLKYLATKVFAYFIHLDINSLPSPTKSDFFKLLFTELGKNPHNLTDQQIFKQIQQKLLELANKENRVVLIFNRFDRLSQLFSYEFFANLRSLRDLDKEKIVMIFDAHKPLSEISPQSISGGNLNMFSHTFCLKPFSIDDLKALTSLNNPNLSFNDNLSSLSGGHYQLLQLLQKSTHLKNPLDDPTIKLQLKELFFFFNHHQRKQLCKLALGKPLAQPDKTLLDYGVIIHNQLFTPLLAQFIKQISRLNLPLKETKLFNLLKQTPGKPVEKEQIFIHVWGKNSLEATDWALNSLIYRLRKNPLFISKGYVIESYKKVGYVLYKN